MLMYLKIHLDSTLSSQSMRVVQRFGCTEFLSNEWQDTCWGVPVDCAALRLDMDRDRCLSVQENSWSQTWCARCYHQQAASLLEILC